MSIANSISFLVFGLIMRFLPIVAPTVVAPDALSVEAAEATTRGLWLVSMGYVLGAVGAWFFLKEMGRRSVLALANARANARQYLQAARETRELARARQIHSRTIAARVAVRVHY